MLEKNALVGGVLSASAGLSAVEEAGGSSSGCSVSGDQLWKPLGFLLLTAYWFNPVCWLAYVLFCRDIEAACDEKVVRELGESCKTAYSRALLQCSVPRRMITACPLAFGETGVKGRIKSVLNYKKPAFWVVLAPKGR